MFVNVRLHAGTLVTAVVHHCLLQLDCHNPLSCQPPAVQVPVAVACSAPEARVQPVLETTGLAPALEAVVTAEDVYRGRPDPEAYLLAAQRLQRPPVRCVVIGNSNQVCTPCLDA